MQGFYHGAVALVVRIVRDLVAVTSVLVLNYAFMFFGKQPQLVYAKRTDLTSLLSIGTLLASAATTWLLAQHYGAIGAALGTTFAGIASVWLFVQVGQRFYRIGYERTRLMVLYGILIVSTLGVAVLLEAGTPYLLRVACKLAAVSIFVLIGLHWRILPRPAIFRTLLASRG